MLILLSLSTLLFFKSYKANVNNTDTEVQQPKPDWRVFRSVHVRHVR